MNIEQFIDAFHEQLDDTDRSELTPATRYKELDEWTSLTALSVIAMIDEEAGISLKSDVFKNSTTLEELYNQIFA